MGILYAPNVNHDMADNLDKINGYLAALADFCKPESDVCTDFYIEKIEIETIELESLIHYYRDILEIDMVCSQIESYQNQTRQAPSRQTPAGRKLHLLRLHPF